MGAEAVKANWEARAVAVLAAGVVLAGFSSLPHTRVFNNSGVQLVIETPRRTFLKHTVVRPGRARNVRPLGPLVVTAASCTYRYKLQDIGREYWAAGINQWNDQVQVEADFKVWLLPATARTGLRGPALGAAQRYGYPISPISKICR